MRCIFCLVHLAFASSRVQLKHAHTHTHTQLPKQTIKRLTWKKKKQALATPKASHKNTYWRHNKWNGNGKKKWKCDVWSFCFNRPVSFQSLNHAACLWWWMSVVGNVWCIRHTGTLPRIKTRSVIKWAAHWHQYGDTRCTLDLQVNMSPPLLIIIVKFNNHNITNNIKKKRTTTSRMKSENERANTSLISAKPASVSPWKAKLFRLFVAFFVWAKIGLLQVLEGNWSTHTHTHEHNWRHKQ